MVRKATLVVMQTSQKLGRIARRIRAAQQAWDALSPVDRLVFAYLWADPEIAADFLEERGLPRLAVHGFCAIEMEAQGEQKQ